MYSSEDTMILGVNYTTLFSDEVYSVKDFKILKNNGIEIIYSKKKLSQRWKLISSFSNIY